METQAKTNHSEVQWSQTDKESKQLTATADQCSSSTDWMEKVRDEGQDTGEVETIRRKEIAEHMACRSVLRRGRGRAWTPQEDAQLMQYVEAKAFAPFDESGRPAGIARAIEDIAADLDRTSVAVRARYYRLLQAQSGLELEKGISLEHAGFMPTDGEGGITGAVRAKDVKVKAVRGKSGKVQRRGSRAPKLSTVPRDSDQDSFLLGLSEFLRRAKNIKGLDLDGMVRGLARLAELAEAGTSTFAMGQRMTDLEQEKENLEERIVELTAQLERVREQYRTLDYLITEFINLGSVDRVTSLGDFGRRLKYQVDQFGVVVNVKRV